MNTIVKDWIIVSVLDDEQLIGEVLYGTVIDDMTCRFASGDYVSTSQIMNIDSSLITTATGSLYQVLGKGRRAIVDFDDFELLRNGFSPEHIKVLKQSSLLIH
ncbi:DUF6957 family protein [Colwellia sp. E150_009]